MASKVGIFICIFSILLLVSLILFGLSFAVLPLNRVGLLRNKVEVRVEPNVIYKPGRHFVGIAGEFIEYPTTWQYISFSKASGSDSYLISGKTKGASSIDLEITLSYRLKWEFLHELYKKFPSQNHHKTMVNTAKSEIQAVISLFNNEDFFNVRGEISKKMSVDVNKIFKSAYYSELTLFLLREIFLEKKFEDNLVTQQVNKRDAITSKMNQEIDVIKGQINVINSEAEIKVNRLLEEANRLSTQIMAERESKGNVEIAKAEAEAFKEWRDPNRLNFTDVEITKYIFSERMRRLDNVDIITGFPANNIVI